MRLSQRHDPDCEFDGLTQVFFSFLIHLFLFLILSFDFRLSRN
jgi:hypothetical protein